MAAYEDDGMAQREIARTHAVRCRLEDIQSALDGIIGWATEEHGASLPAGLVDALEDVREDLCDLLEVGDPVN